MSSLKVAVRESVADLAREDTEAGWVPVVSPLDDEPVGDVSSVVSSITALRDRYSKDADESIDVDPVPCYGGGDVELADMISEDMANRWDN